MQNEVDKEFGLWRDPVFAVFLILIWFALLVFFRAAPQIDLGLASLYYSAGFCDVPRVGVPSNAPCYYDFPVSQQPLILAVRNVLNMAPRVIGVLLLVWIAFDYFGGARLWHRDFQRKVVVLGSLLLGPLLIVNVGLKSYFGRVRPRDLEMFGGTGDFTMAGDMVGQCTSNCSFVSGEAAIAGWFLSLALFVPARHRRFAYFYLGLLGVTMAFLRTTFGAHFLSDVVLGYLVSLICICLMVQVVMRFGRAKAPLSPPLKSR